MKTLEKKLEDLIAWRVFQGTLKKLKEYDEVTNSVDIPEFMKPKNEQIQYRADAYVKRLKRECRLNEVYLQEFSQA